MLPETRYSLIARLARSEDVETWLEFSRTYEKAIFRYCRSIGLQDADAVEVCQEVLIAVHHIAPRWEPSGRAGSFRAWLFETARRSCLKSLCQRQHGSLDSKGSDEIANQQPELLHQMIEQESKDQETWSFYAAASLVQSEVEPTTWASFWKTAVEGIPAKTVASHLGISIGVVYTAKCRVMNRIRTLVQELSILDSASLKSGEPHQIGRDPIHAHLSSPSPKNQENS